MPDVLTRGRVRTETAPVIDDGSENFDGWFCLKVIPEPCACGQFISDYSTVMHLILVWPEMDDPNLLDLANFMQQESRDPKVVEYENKFGKCISYYEMKNNPNIQPHHIRG